MQMFKADGFGARLHFGKSRSGTLGTMTAVQDDDEIGVIVFNPADGTDMASEAARIGAYIDGTPGGNDTPGRLVFATTADGAADATERLRIDSAGVVTIASGQIAFPATQNASADANTLDDYEEGTWVATLNGMTISYTANQGYYTKVGNLVTAYVYINVQAQSTGTSATYVEGLPFVNHASAPYASCSFGQIYQVDVATGSPGDLLGAVAPSSANIGLYSAVDDGNWVQLTGTAFNGTNVGIMISCTYVTNT